MAFFAVACIFLFLAMLLFPKEVFAGASQGLLLWFHTVFPTLFPFMVISALLTSTGGARVVSRLFHPLLFRLFRTSENGSFAVLTGFLCGYPMGAKTAGDLVRNGQITQAEGQYLISFCNNLSPAFLMNYIVWNTLKEERLLVPTLLIQIGVPVILSFFFRRMYLKSSASFSLSDDKASTKPTVSGSAFDLLDKSLTDSFEAITKVGGYIILFSVFLKLSEQFFDSFPFLRYAAALLEVTNGVRIAGEGPEPLLIRYPFVMGISAFGGFCAAAQTQSMMRRTSIRIFPYIMQKLTAGAAASLLAFLFFRFFQPFA